MRAVVALLLLGGCSLIAETDSLRDRDAGPAPDAAVDLGADLGQDAEVPGDMGLDGGPDRCGMHPRPTGLSRPMGGPFDQLTLSLDAPAPAALEYDVGGVTAGFAVASDSTMVRQRIPLLSESIVVTDPAGCATTLTGLPTPTVELMEVGGLGSFTTARGASMDIADDGTVVFISSSPELGGDDDEHDHLHRWPMGGSPPELLDSGLPPTGVAEGITAPRISDDGRLIVFWIERDSRFRYRFEAPVGGAVLGSFSHTASQASHDVRTDPTVAEGDRRYVIAQDGEADAGTAPVMHGAFLGSAFDGSELGLASIPNGNGPLLGLALGTYHVGFLRMEEPVGFSDGVPDLTTFPNCLSSYGLVHARGSQLAFIGGCRMAGPGFYRITGTMGIEPMPIAGIEDLDRTGILSTTRDGSLHLLRRQGLTAYWIFIEAEGRAVPLNIDGTETVQAAPRSVAYDGAALSPSGEWAVYPIATSPAGAPNASFQLARVRVR